MAQGCDMAVQMPYSRPAAVTLLLSSTLHKTWTQHRKQPQLLHTQKLQLLPWPPAATHVQSIYGVTPGQHQQNITRTWHAREHTLQKRTPSKAIDGPSHCALSQGQKTWQAL
jgi:hypothetical protein